MEICAVLAEARSQHGSQGRASYHKLLVSIRVCRVLLQLWVCNGTKFPRALAAHWQGQEQGGYWFNSLFLLLAKHTGFAQHL